MGGEGVLAMKEIKGEREAERERRGGGGGGHEWRKINWRGKEGENITDIIL